MVSSKALSYIEMEKATIESTVSNLKNPRLRLAVLEIESQAELNEPGITGSYGFAKQRASHIPHRGTKIHLVRYIEHLGKELNIDPVTHKYVFGNSCIKRVIGKTSS